jgi:hypothetical protein
MVMAVRLIFAREGKSRRTKLHAIDNVFGGIGLLVLLDLVVLLVRHWEGGFDGLVSHCIGGLFCRGFLVFVLCSGFCSCLVLAAGRQAGLGWSSIPLGWDGRLDMDNGDGRPSWSGWS